MLVFTIEMLARIIHHIFSLSRLPSHFCPDLFKPYISITIDRAIIVIFIRSSSAQEIKFITETTDRPFY